MINETRFVRSFGKGVAELGTCPSQGTTCSALLQLRVVKWGLMRLDFIPTQIKACSALNHCASHDPKSAILAQHTPSPPKKHTSRYHRAQHFDTHLKSQTMAPSAQAHKRAHSLLLFEKLLNLRDTASPLTLILDTLEQSAQPLTNEFMRRAKVS